MHICLDISDHGYGHLAQIAPVADRLRIHMPNMKLTIRSRIPAKIISRFVTGPIQFEPAASEAKVHMAGPSEMLVKETASEFKNLHENWHDIISHEANVLNALSPDILVTDITYSSLAAAHQVGLPAVGVSSLNWADIYQAYCGVYEESQSIIEQIFAAYNSADAFLQLTPHLPMPHITNRASIGPSARLSPTSLGVVRQRARLTNYTRVVLVGFGGIQGTGRPSSLPELANTVWVSEQSASEGRNDVYSLKDLDLQFYEAVPDADLVVTKPGYGTIVEAACQGARVLLQERPDWPETEIMMAWLEEHGCFAPISGLAMATGNIGAKVDALLQRHVPTPFPQPSGADEAAKIIAGFSKNASLLN
jgi:hypothetical protein